MKMNSRLQHQDRDMLMKTTLMKDTQMRVMGHSPLALPTNEGINCYIHNTTNNGTESYRTTRKKWALDY